MDTFAAFLLAWIPFYNLLKAVFVIYLMLPMTKGADKIYDLAIRPALLRYQDGIDDGITRLSDAIRSAADDGEPKAESEWDQAARDDAAYDAAGAGDPAHDKKTA